MHIGIIGGTGSGKTFLMTKIIPIIAKRGKYPLFCSDLGIDVEQCHKFDAGQADEFRRAHFTRENVGRFSFIDEAATTIGRGKKAEKFLSLATKGRHAGSLCVFAAQRFTGIHFDMRKQCTTWIVFRQNFQDDADALADLVGCDLVRQAPLLDNGNFIFVRDGKGEVCRLV